MSTVTVRGATTVRWKPAYTLALSSPDGNSLPANGLTHRLIATLTHTSNGTPVVGRQVRLTTSPTSRVGDGVRRVTDGSGEATFSVGDLTVENVGYAADLPPLANIVSSQLVIAWTGPGCFISCNSVTKDVLPFFNDDGGTPNYCYWYVRYDVRCYDSGGSFTVLSSVIVGEAKIFTGSAAAITDCTEMLAFIVPDSGGGSPTTSGFACSTTGDGAAVNTLGASIVSDPTGNPYRLNHDAALALIQASACV